MSPLLKQIKQRRLALGFKQNDMLMRIGISRQQYQRLESKGNPRLDTLELIAKGLNSELLLIPREKLDKVKALLENEGTGFSEGKQSRQEDSTVSASKNLSEDPWQGLLGDDT